MALFGGRVDAQVTALGWSRVVQTQQQEWVSKRSAWRPGEDARNVEKRTETHWEALTDTMPGAPGANGMPGPPVTTTRNELRTRVVYTFEIQEWRKGRTLRASGADRESVAWPDYTLGARERVIDRKASYSVTFASASKEGKEYETTLPEQEWRSLPVGAACHLELGLFGKVKKVTLA